MAFQKINDSDTLVDWKNKFNNNADETIDLKNRLDILEAGGTTDGELIALRSSTTLGFTGATADERVEYAEQKILDNESRITALENKDLKILNVRDFGAKGDGVTDDAAAIQAALDAANAAGGAEVYVPDGVYPIKSSLLIYNYTRLRLSPRATIIRASTGVRSGMLKPGIGDVDGYDGVHDVEIVGGIWDCNARQFPDPLTGITFAHARNIIIRDATFLDVYNYHCIELNSTQNGLVLNCLFKGFSGTRKSEAVQLDHMKSSSNFASFGNYDNTPCDNILIAGCTFEDWSRGIGNHSATKDIFHTNIRIIGNHFRNLTGQAIRAYQWKYVSIIGNTFDNCEIGIEIRPGTGSDASDNGYATIKGNVIKNIHGVDGHGIWLNGDPGVYIINAVVSDNVIYDTAVNGIYLSYVRNCVVANNNIRKTGNQGISLFDASYCMIQGNHVMHAQFHGIILNTTTHSVVHGNICQDNQQVGPDAPSANIRLIRAETNYNNIQGNICRAGSFTDYGIRIDSDCTGNLVTNNDLYNGGKISNLRNDSGSTVTTAGNRT